jgi:hypothetical protein
MKLIGFSPILLAKSLKCSLIAAVPSASKTRYSTLFGFPSGQYCITLFYYQISWGECFYGRFGGILPTATDFTDLKT